MFGHVALLSEMRSDPEVEYALLLPLMAGLAWAWRNTARRLGAAQKEIARSQADVLQARVDVSALRERQEELLQQLAAKDGESIRAFEAGLRKLRALVATDVQDVSTRTVSPGVDPERAETFVNMLESLDEGLDHALQELAKRFASNQEGLAQACRALSADVDALSEEGDREGPVAQLKKSAGELASLSATVAEEAEQGYRAVHATIDEIEHIRGMAGTVKTEVTRLGEQIAGVGGIVRAIREIAQKTNLLSLNASIVAARAGQHGKAFAVLAEEIKLLASKTRSATEEIDQQVEEIQGKNILAVQAVGDAEQAVESGFRVALQAGDALARIRQASRRSQKRNESMARTLDLAARPEAQTSGVEILQPTLTQLSDAVSRGNTVLEVGQRFTESRTALQETSLGLAGWLEQCRERLSNHERHLEERRRQGDKMVRLLGDIRNELSELERAL